MQLSRSLSSRVDETGYPDLVRIHAEVWERASRARGRPAPLLSLSSSALSSWPVWMVTPEHDGVTLLPTASGDGDEGWVNPISFEQLWQL